MRTLVFAPSGARVWIFLIRRFIGQLNWDRSSQQRYYPAAAVWDE